MPIGGVSAGLYHNFYGALAGAPGAGYPAPSGGDLYYNTTTNLMYYYNAAIPAWVALATSGVDIRDSKYIVGNVANGDIAGTNVDFAGNVVSGPTFIHALQQALNLMAAGLTVFKGGQVHVREGNYSGIPAAGNDAVPAPVAGTPAPFYIPATMAENVIIEGDGAVIFVNSVGNANPVFVLAHPVSGKTITLKGVFVTGNGSNGGGTIEVGDSLAIVPLPGPDVTLENVQVFANNDQFGIVLAANTAAPFAASDNFRGKDLTVWGAKADNIIVTPAGAARANNLIFERCKTYGGIGASCPGFVANHCDNLKVLSSESYQNKSSGFFLNDCARSEITSCFAHGNQLNLINASAGIYIKNGVDIACANNEANSNALPTGGGDNFLIESGQNVTVVGCIANNTDVGFAQPNNGFHALSSNYVTFEACYASNHMTDGVANGMGFLGESCTYTNFNDCTGLNNSNYGIKLGLAAALCTRCEIVAGTYKLNGGGLGGIYDPEVYDLSGATTTNELAHFQWI